MNIKGKINQKQSLKGGVSIPELIVGKSAYDVAVDNGFEGDEQAWLESLKGDRGYPGLDGKTPYIKDGNWWIGTANTGVKAEGTDGEKGADGTSVTILSLTQSTEDGGSNTVRFSDGKALTVKNGRKGSDGTNGKDGADGAKGDKGDQGEQGIQGIQGVQGEKGDKGDKGDTGADGKDGANGTNGKDGVSATHSWNGTTLTITSASGTSSANLKGEQGIQGEKGADGTTQLVPLFANSIEECTDTSKLYVLPDGYIYGYIISTPPLPEITIESKSGGYYNYDVNNDRFQWIESSGWSGKLTNKIPVTAGDQLTYKGKIQYGSNKSYVWFNANNIEISSGQLNSESSPTTITAPEGATYLICNSFSQATAILEVEWVVCQASAPKYMWASTGHAFVPADYEDRIVDLENNVTVLKSGVNNVLRNKKIIYDGDSICQGVFGGGGYAKIIADMTNGMFVNQAIGGGRLTTASNGATYHSVVDNIANLPKDGDLYCFEGGINDYWTPKALGTFSKTDFTGTLDTNTICGALETIFRYALTNFIGKPICFVISHKIQSTAYIANSSGDTFEDYRNAMVGICEKYSIPYYDAFSESGLNGWNTAQSNAFLTGCTEGTADGIHPNEEGYKRYYVPQLIALFEKIMPIE